MTLHPVLVAGRWRAADASSEFRARDPRTGDAVGDTYPTSRWSDVDEALDAAAAAARALRAASPDVVADFLEGYADRIEARAGEICALAGQETALPTETRLAGIELPRTTGQLRKAAAAARAGDWAQATIDTAAGIRSVLEPIGPVVVFGPNNFPLAFGSASGGDFAAAVAAGNPVIAKAHPLHPGTTRLLAEEAHSAAESAGLPPGAVQLLYDVDHAEGERLVADPRVGAVAFTGSRSGGLALKRAADAAGTPIYLELGAVNPTFVLPGALAERGAAIAGELAGSCLLGTGQFCTNPGLVLTVAGDRAEALVEGVADAFRSAPAGTLFSGSGRDGLARAVAALRTAGAESVVGGGPEDGTHAVHQNTLLRVDGAAFLERHAALQEEAFGNAMLVVVAADEDELVRSASLLEASLTGCIVSAHDGGDDALYGRVQAELRPRVGRLLDDKMPTGVAVSPAMHHGGPFPAAGHPGFTAVGVPGALRRFAGLACYDNVRPHRLPPLLADANPRGAWRSVDGEYTKDPIASDTLETNR
ncbi:MAG: aldehyde dehydrogenase family protein [Planctomycetota bacterium]